MDGKYFLQYLPAQFVSEIVNVSFTTRKIGIKLIKATEMIC